MSLQELIELAILDAMGLLDEREQSAFEAAFRVASPAIQAQVRREQTRLSRIEALLPDVTPPAGLRAAVLAVIRDEIAAGQKQVAGTITPTMYKSRGVSPVWRAAALGLAAAAVVLAVATFEWKRQYQVVRSSLQQDALLTRLREEVGATYVKDVLFSRDTKRVVFRPVAEGFSGEASLFINPEWKTAKFFGQSMASPESQPFRLAIIDEHNQIVQVLAPLDSDGRLFSRDVTLAMNAKGSVAIVAQPASPGSVPVILGKADLSS